MPFEFFDQVLHIRVLIPLSIVLGFFGPLLLSVYKTWNAGVEKVETDEN